jgi:hypothetical protein
MNEAPPAQPLAELAWRDHASDADALALRPLDEREAPRARPNAIDAPGWLGVEARMSAPRAIRRREPEPFLRRDAVGAVGALGGEPPEPGGLESDRGARSTSRGRRALEAAVAIGSPRARAPRPGRAGRVRAAAQ